MPNEHSRAPSVWETPTFVELANEGARLCRKLCGQWGFGAPALVGQLFFSWPAGHTGDQLRLHSFPPALERRRDRRTSV